MTENFRMLKKSFTFPLKRASIVETGQCIVITLVLHALPFQHNRGKVFDKSDLRIALAGGLHTDVADCSVGK